MSKYNEQPEYWREITDKEFAHLFFMYILKKGESRQIHRDAFGNKVDPLFSVRLWEIHYSGWEGLGVAMAWTDNQMKYYQYGDPERWKIRSNAFAAQFAGDNS